MGKTKTKPALEQPAPSTGVIEGLPQDGWTAAQYAACVDAAVEKINATELLAVDYLRLGLSLNRVEYSPPLRPNQSYPDYCKAHGIKSYTASKARKIAAWFTTAERLAILPDLTVNQALDKCSEWQGKPSRSPGEKAKAKLRQAQLALDEYHEMLAKLTDEEQADLFADEETATLIVKLAESLGELPMETP